MRLANFREEWRSVSFEKKLTLFVAPIFVAVTSGLLLRSLTNDSGAPVASVPKGVMLQVLKVAVDGAAGTEETPAIDITIKNTGSTIGVITGATLTVRDFARTEACVMGETLGSSATYGVMLPPDPRSGEIIDVSVSQQLAPNSADRFRIDLALAEDVGVDNIYLYHLTVSLKHDVNDVPLAAGDVVVALPYAPSPHAFNPDPEDLSPIAACSRRNRETVERFVRYDAAKPSSLIARLRD